MGLSEILAGRWVLPYDMLVRIAAAHADERTPGGMPSARVALSGEDIP